MERVARGVALERARCGDERRGWAPRARGRSHRARVDASWERAVRVREMSGGRCVRAGAVADRDVERERSDKESSAARGRLAARARGGVTCVVAEDEEAFDVAAKLRATAFYDDLLERGEMPFPRRFAATFHREFAQRERRALQERTTRRVGQAIESRCFMADVDGLGLVGCLDVSVREGPCASQINGVCVEKGASYAYIDNVAVDASARRRGAARLMMESASDFVLERGIAEVWTHVHAENIGARKLYHTFGFRAPTGAFPETGLPSYFSGERLKGLILMRAPVPLVFDQRLDHECGCGACFENVQHCVCCKSLVSR